MIENYETANVLKAFRVRRGLSIEEASKQIGWHFNTYARKEKKPLDTSILDLCIMVQKLSGDFEVLFNAIEQDFKSYKYDDKKI